MAKKTLPAPKKGTYFQNKTFPIVYELQPIGLLMPFLHFNLTKPRERYLSDQGAVYIADSQKEGIKTLNTGLRATKAKGIFTGDLYEPATKKKSLLIFRMLHNQPAIEVYFFDGYYPRSINRIINQIAGL